MSEDWKPYPPQKYREETESLVHFTAKVVNSNAIAAGVRLGPEDALDMPYVSLRTLLGSGLSFPLEYAEGGAGKAGIVKQIISFTIISTEYFICLFSSIAVRYRINIY